MGITDMRITILTLLLPCFITAMQLTEQQQREQEAHDNYLTSRLLQMLPPDQVTYFLQNMPRLQNHRGLFHNPLNIYLANDYTVALHYGAQAHLDVIRIVITCNPNVVVTRPKLSSSSHGVEMPAAKFVELLQRIKRMPKTID